MLAFPVFQIRPLFRIKSLILLSLLSLLLSCTHAYRNYEKYLRLILAIYMPHFARLRSTSLAAALVPYGGLFEIPGSPNAPCSILIDVGYSYSHVTPVVDGKVVWSAIRR